MEMHRMEAGLFCIPLAIGYDPRKFSSEDVLEEAEWDMRFAQIIENAIELALEEHVEFVRVFPNLIAAHQIGELQREILEALCPEAESAEGGVEGTTEN
jgi:hypothetical protein